MNRQVSVENKRQYKSKYARVFTTARTTTTDKQTNSLNNHNVGTSERLRDRVEHIWTFPSS